MHYRIVLFCTVVVLLNLAACQQQAPSPSSVETSTPAETIASQPQGPTVITNPSIVEPNRLMMYVSDPRVQTWDGIGSLEGDRLVSKAANGHLMFGPKLPFEAGRYRVTIYGDRLQIMADNSVLFDVASNAGKEIHAEFDLDDKFNFVPTEPMATFEFELAAPVDDLEVRAYVTSGAAVTLTRYEVTPISDTAD